MKNLKMQLFPVDWCIQTPFCGSCVVDKVVVRWKCYDKYACPLRATLLYGRQGQDYFRRLKCNLTVNAQVLVSSLTMRSLPTLGTVGSCTVFFSFFFFFFFSFTRWIQEEAIQRRHRMTSNTLYLLFYHVLIFLFIFLTSSRHDFSKYN